MSQLTIWPTGPLARATDPDTSRTAVVRDLSTLQASVLACLVVKALTDDELVQRFPDEDPGTVKKRRTELAKAGLVHDTGERRPTRRGRPAAVWST